MSRSNIRALLACLLLTTAPAVAQQETVLERYSLQVGESASSVSLDLIDKALGNGTARSRITLMGSEVGSRLDLRVARRVRQGEVVFALLVFKVEVRGYDALDNAVYSRDLDGFTFGDSQGGKWAQSLTGFPPELSRLEVTYYGNYE